jgi:hypothetical protein
MVLPFIVNMLGHGDALMYVGYCVLVYSGIHIY